jgi:lipopolysaccharide/colanic/teichoic acid biosynthesis glycosyltransferase
MNRPAQRRAYGGADGIERWRTARDHASAVRFSLSLSEMRPSPWSRSGARRLFDCVCVLLALPLLVPALLAIALAVRLTSHGPVLFLQKRVGRHGRIFTILKFRTMIHATDKAHHAVTTASNQRFTPVGSFLRRWKLDELPQLLNVLWGDMSLVGPRPKMPEHVIFDLPYRPGITGAATIAFAREEVVLDRVPRHHLESYYHTVVLPAKRRLDAEYMARATFLSDLKLIVDSVLRRWDSSVMESLLNAGPFEAEGRMPPSRASDPEAAFTRVPIPPSVDRPAQEQSKSRLSDRLWLQMEARQRGVARALGIQAIEFSTVERLRAGLIAAGLDAELLRWSRLFGQFFS